MSVVENPFYGIDGVVKRIEDVLLGSLILTDHRDPDGWSSRSPSSSTSQGPVFFRQRRYGLNGEEIRVLKFRTMTVMRRRRRGRASHARTTRASRAFGAFLRRTSLDELPQFIQVLTGEMSIVGPRPHAVAHNEQYRSLIQRLHAAATRSSRASPAGRRSTAGAARPTRVEKMEKRVQYDLDYISNWNLGLDLKIIAMTVWTVLRGRNAY